MTITADFKINDSAYAQRKYDAEAGQELTLELEDALAVDVSLLRFRVVLAAEGSGDLTGLADPVFVSPPSGSLVVTVPLSDETARAWMIECQINNGTDASGRVVPEWTRRRIVAIRNSKGLRKLVPTERDEYDVDGWTTQINEIVDAIQVIDGGGGPTPEPDPLEGLDVESEHRADEGVEAGAQYVQRWVDQRSFNHFVPIERDLAIWYFAGPSVENVITTTAADALRAPLAVTRDFDADGDAIVRPGYGVGAMWSRTPLVRNLETFSIALRLRMASGNGQTVLSLGRYIPQVADDCPKLVLSWAYTSGLSGTLTATLVDGAVSQVDASKTLTHSAWHNVIVRFDGSDLSVRVDGSNGTPVDFSVHDDLSMEHSTIACEYFPDGTVNGQIFSGTALRHIVAATRAWTDAECLTVEGYLTDEWS